MTYKSLGSKATNIGRTIGSKTYSLTGIGSKNNPLSYVGNTVKNLGFDIANHKIMDKFAPLNIK